MTAEGTLKVLYLLLHDEAPSERFISREIAALRAQGTSIRVAVIGPSSARAASPAGEAFVRRPSWRAPEMWSSAIRLAVARPSLAIQCLFIAWQIARGRSLSQRLRGLRWILVSAHFASRLQGDPPDVIHAHFGTEPATAALLLAHVLDLPWGFSVHARDLYASHSGLEEKVARCNYVLTCSEVAGEDLRTLLPRASRDRVQVLHHGLDLRAWSLQPVAPDGDLPLVLGVGRLVPKKGFAHLIEACSLLRDRGLPFRCAIVGEGLEREQLERDVARHRLQSLVTLIPWLTEDDLRDHYTRARVLVVPSVVAADGDRDNIPNVLVEALALGIPVVASALPALQRLLSPTGAGVLARPGDARELADVLFSACTDDSHCERLRSTGRQLAELRFDAGVNAALLTQTLSDARAAGSRR